MLFLMSLLPFLWQLQSLEYAVGHTYDAVLVLMEVC
jgi:hypothetical protein